MNFDKVPGWVAWLAQDGNGASHPHGAGRGCEPLKWNSHALGLRRRANKQDCGWYENEVGRIVRLGKAAPPDDWEATLTAWPPRHG